MEKTIPRGYTIVRNGHGMYSSHLKYCGAYGYEIGTPSKNLEEHIELCNNHYKSLTVEIILKG